MPRLLTFARSEHLKSEKLISRLFKEGASFSAYPVRLVWLKVRCDNPTDYIGAGSVVSRCQVAFSVPKKNFKSSVLRNRIRRRVREAYRLHKTELNDTPSVEIGSKYALMIIYIAKEELPFQDIEKGIIKMINKWKYEISATR